MLLTAKQPPVTIHASAGSFVTSIGVPPPVVVVEFESIVVPLMGNVVVVLLTAVVLVLLVVFVICCAYTKQVSNNAIIRNISLCE